MMGDFGTADTNIEEKHKHLQTASCMGLFLKTHTSHEAPYQNRYAYAPACTAD